LRDSNERYYSRVFRACAILHNMCLKAKDPMRRSEVEEIMAEEAKAREKRYQVYEGALLAGKVAEGEGELLNPASSLEQGRRKRTRLMRAYFD